MNQTKGFVLGLVSVASVLAAAGCTREKVVTAAACRKDDDCTEGTLCDNYQCVPREARACDVVIDGNPILQPEPHSVDFGRTDTQDTKLQTVTLHNIGNCTLTLFEASLKSREAFGCDLCDTTFPKEVWPGRELSLNVAFHPTKVGEASTELTLLSDDKEYPTLRVPLHANYLGTPKLVALPNPVNFGYVATARNATRTMQVTNQGTGTATATVTAVSLDPPTTQDFEVKLLPTLPVTLKPVASDAHSVLSFEVHYIPRTVASHTASLVLTTSVGELRVPLAGNSETPPKITINPQSIDLGDVTLGSSNFAPLTIVNEGGAPLEVHYLWGGPAPSTDLWATPTHLPLVPAGQYVEMRVAVTAATQTTYNGLLVLTTNDPQHPSLTVPVNARGVPGTGPAVVKIDMNYENGSSSAFDDDLRRVDLTLEHPFGFVCNKRTPHPNWGGFGTATWMTFPPKDDPKRIVLTDCVTDGTFRVMANYEEDCSSVPTGLLAALLGISLDVLIDYLSGGTVPLDPAELARIIASICLSHSSSAASVKVYVNGAQVGQKQSTLGSKGDAVYVLDLVRSNGTFTVR